MTPVETTLTQKGQATIPREIRERLGLKPRDKVRFELVGERVTLVAAAASLLDTFGAVSPRRRPEDWRKVRAEAEQAMAEEAASDR